MSALVTACVIYLSGGSHVNSGAIFLGLIMVWSGWNGLFNLLSLWVGRQDEAHCADYDDEGAQAARMMSPRLTTVLSGVFWFNSGLMMMVELNS
ncbi:hypothetical protein HNO88_002562 [Novosphingobium chloroacetimidivorans]|uniref:Uncharacterized protein n=1 Tax=Novosphingobium chloroacetimidivorans TaxID=1428314 RepID=A0A7W7KBX6_9SPHN|nr:hypothetical protein [Novosphingobium chloroacetimidivorans]MBB4859233.1 hypothetical protein [Novosphingobium chloroacetimidivorans]